MSGIRCENMGCRGNAPCPACLMGLSAAIGRAIDRILDGSTSTSEAMARGGIRRWCMDSVKKELDAYWAKTVSFPTELPFPTENLTPGARAFVEKLERSGSYGKLPEKMTLTTPKGKRFTVQAGDEIVYKAGDVKARPRREGRKGKK